VSAYVVARQKAAAANGTINRELAALSKAYKLAAKYQVLAHRPYIEKLSEAGRARQGFFEAEDFLAVRARLPRHLQPVATFGFITGWRRREILGLRWGTNINFAENVVRLEAPATKNARAREFEMTPDLRALLEAQRRVTDEAQRELQTIIPFVFHRNGRPIRSFYRSWRTACRATGVHRIFHDLRRSAVRTLEAANVPRSTAMAMTGHRTERVYAAYAITEAGTRKHGAEKLARHHASTLGTRLGTHGVSAGDLARQAR